MRITAMPRRNETKIGVYKRVCTEARINYDPSITNESQLNEHGTASHFNEIYDAYLFDVLSFITWQFTFTRKSLGSPVGTNVNGVQTGENPYPFKYIFNEPNDSLIDAEFVLYNGYIGTAQNQVTDVSGRVLVNYRTLSEGITGRFGQWYSDEYAYMRRHPGKILVNKEHVDIEYQVAVTDLSLWSDLALNLLTFRLARVLAGKFQGEGSVYDRLTREVEQLEQEALSRQESMAPKPTQSIDDWRNVW